jgi:hypothetical protein
VCVAQAQRLKMHKHCRLPSASFCIILGRSTLDEIADGDAALVVADKHYSQTLMSRATVCRFRDQPAIKFDMPLTSVPADTMFADMVSQVQQRVVYLVYLARVRGGS